METVVTENTLPTFKLAKVARHVLEQEINDAQRFYEACLSKNTRRAYKSDIDGFLNWCDDRGYIPFSRDPEIIDSLPILLSTYLSFLAKNGKKYATINRKKASLNFFYETNRIDSPARDIKVRKTLKGIRNTILAAQDKSKAATEDIVSNILQKIPRDLKGARDRAIISMGFTGAFRRSELAGLRMKDITFVKQGLTVFLSKSKTDQDGKGEWVLIPKSRKNCPVKSLNKWLARADITHNYLFRRIFKGGRCPETLRKKDKATDSYYTVPNKLEAESLNDIFKHYAGLAGYNVSQFSFHSLRAGMITSAAERDVPIANIMKHSRHKSLSALQEYLRPILDFSNHPLSSSERGSP